jgi:SAM-dependent methyltransferase
MSRFSADWLALREPYDLRARNVAVLDAAIAWCKDIFAIRIVDLGCGTGSTLRALAPRLPGRQNWRLFDNDLGLLARATARAPPAVVTVTATPLDLGRGLEAALDGSIDLITTSALLDLVSESWLERLVVELSARSIPFYAAISHDGRIEIVPPDPFDTMIVAAVNLHQRTDKGFGPALGGTSAPFAITRLRSLGYSVIHGTSDWVLEPHDCDIQMELFSSWAAAARQTGQMAADTVNWLARRRESVAARQSSISVGHVDFWARKTGNL